MPESKQRRRLETLRARLFDDGEGSIRPGLRPEWGSAGLSAELGPKLDELTAIAARYMEIADTDSEEDVADFCAVVEPAISALLNAQRLDSAAYATQSNQLRHVVDAALNAARGRAPRIIARVLIQRGLLEPEELERKVSAVEAARDSAALQLQTMARQLTDQWRAEAAADRAAAKRSAEGVSLAVAQAEFTADRKRLRHACILWAALLTCALLASTAVLARFLSDAPWVHAGQADVVAAAIYAAAVRVVVATALLGVATFCARTFRAYLHMARLNEHRIHVANCVDAFVAAARTEAQQDVVLLRLVDAVVAFGNSGLLPGDADTLAAQRTPLDGLLGAAGGGRGT